MEVALFVSHKRTMRKKVFACTRVECVKVNIV